MRIFFRHFAQGAYIGKIHRVAVVLETYNEHGRAIMRGVARCVARGLPWQLHAAPVGRNDRVILKAAAGADGLITWPRGRLEVAVREAGIPTVAVNDRGKLPIPVVQSDPDKIVALAVDHFLAQGFRRFAFFGAREKLRFSVEREKAFKHLLAKRGYDCMTFNGGSVHDTEFQWKNPSKALLRWLRELPKPIAVLAANDVAGKDLLLIAPSAGVHVPDEMAVVGVDNDELVCSLTFPPMSSIDNGAERIGFEAAALLDRLLRGHRIGPRTVIVNPGQLVVRQSSDVLAVDDPRVAEAVRYIRQNTAANLNVDMVLSEVTVPRRSLEMAFRKSLGRSIHEEIAGSRIRRARQLLAETNLSIPEITTACGFTNRTRMGKVFKEHTRHTLAAYRRIYRKPR